MKITKLNHSTLLLNQKNKNILFDPGDYSIEEIKDLKDLDLLIITHNHPDHLHLDSIKSLIANNPDLHIISNTEVSNLLNKENIQVEICDNGMITQFNGISISSYDFPHATIWKDMVHPQNTGYLIDDIFYNPGDSFGVINKDVKICCFMLTGPACKISEGLEFTIAQKPEIAIGVHDGMLNRITGSQKLPENILPKHKIQYFNLENNQVYEF